MCDRKPAAGRNGGPQLINVREVAALLGCSPRHVQRLAKAGGVPAPVRLGALVCWQRAAIERWVTAGCRPVARIPRGEDQR